jgi:protein-S-isoprenylcysteine O-methyltransferase Ste14
MEPASLSTAFAVWAAVVGMIGAAIVFELIRLRSELRIMAKNLNDYILYMERRATHTETYLQMKHEDYQPLRRGE